MGIEASASGNSSADLRCDANGCHISASAEGGFSAELKGAKGIGVSFGLSGEAASTHDVSTEDGVTTYTAEARI